MNRRDFLRALGIGAATVAVVEPVRKMWFVPSSAPVGSRVERLGMDAALLRSAESQGGVLHSTYPMWRADRPIEHAIGTLSLEGSRDGIGWQRWDSDNQVMKVAPWEQFRAPSDEEREFVIYGADNVPHRYPSGTIFVQPPASCWAEAQAEAQRLIDEQSRMFAEFGKSVINVPEGTELSWVEPSVGPKVRVTNTLTGESVAFRTREWKPDPNAPDVYFQLAPSPERYQVCGWDPASGPDSTIISRVDVKNGRITVDKSAAFANGRRWGKTGLAFRSAAKSAGLSDDDIDSLFKLT